MIKKLMIMVFVLITMPCVFASAKTVNKQKNFDAYTYTNMIECYSYSDPNYSAEKPVNFGIYGNKYFGNTMGGECIVYKNFNFGEIGARSLELDYSVSGERNGILEFRKGSADGQILARFESEDNGEWNNPIKRTASVSVCEFATGTFDLYVVIKNDTFGNLYGFQFFQREKIISDAYKDIPAMQDISEYYGYDINLIAGDGVTGLRVDSSYIAGLGDDSTRNVEYNVDFGNSAPDKLIINADVTSGAKVRFYHDCPKGELLQEVRLEAGIGEQSFEITEQMRGLSGVENICIAFDNNINAVIHSFRFDEAAVNTLDDNTNYLKTDNYIDKSSGVSIKTSEIKSFMGQTSINEFVTSENGDYITYLVDFGKTLDKKFIAADLRAKSNGTITVTTVPADGESVVLATIEVSPRTREQGAADYSNITYISLGSELSDEAKNLTGVQQIKVTFNGEADFCRLNSIGLAKHYTYSDSSSAAKCHSWTTTTNVSGKLGGFDNINKYASWVMDFGEQDSGIKDVKMNFSTSAAYHNEFVQVRLDSPDGEVIAEHMVNMEGKANWSQHYITAPVLKEIRGVHLVYVTQNVDSKYSSCLNPAGDIFNIQFVDREENVVTSSRVQSVYYHPKSGDADAYYDDEMLIEKTVRFYADKIKATKFMNIIAFYAENGIIYEEFISDYDVKEGMNIIEMNVDWNDLKESGTYEIKGFFWDEETLAPLTDSYEDMGNINVEQSV